MTSPWVRGTKAPVHDELDVADLEVVGSIPPELNGRLVRMTPNPIGPVGDDHVWFVGEGMVHAIDIADGAATRYTNRWVRTRPVADALGEATDLDPVEDGVDVSNTSVFRLVGKTYALTETCPPYVLDDDLHTIGRDDFGGGVEHFTAHPHTDPTTGEIFGIGYRGDQDPSCTLHVIGPDGRLCSSTEIGLLAPRSVHDVAVTTDHVVVWDLPLEIEPDAPEPRFPFAWNREGGARVGLIDRAAPDRGVRWHEIDPCWVFHPLNAYETDAGVVVDVCQFDRIMDVDRTGPGDPFPPQLWRWTIDRSGGPVRREMLDDRVQEFPRLDDRFWGRPNRFGLTVELMSRGGRAAVIAHDLAAGTTQTWESEPGHSISEAVFTPHGPEAGEGEGWVIAVDSTPRESEVVILDATALSDGPIARVRLPQRIPDGFHGDWLPTAR